MSLIKKYKENIDLLKSEKRKSIEHFSQTHCTDDAKLCKIELNIIEIFEKMFEASVQKAQSSSDHTDKVLKDTYLSFFDKIPSNWKTELNDCEKFGNFEGAHIERSKIKQADAMKSIFLELYLEEV